MKPYPIPSCSGPCQQGKVPCRTEARCTLEMHRTLPNQVMDREYEQAITMEDDEIMSPLGIAVFVVAVAFALSAAYVAIFY